MNLRHIGSSIEYRLPKVFLTVARIRYASSTQESGPVPVSRKTAIVIEGFPRCGNTFALEAFRYLQAPDVSVAHHLHSFAQIAVAASRDIPVLAVFRDPRDAIVSFALREPKLDFGLEIHRYIEFYTHCLQMDKGVLLSSFESLTEDFGSVIARLNAFFGTRFSTRSLDDGDVAMIFERIDERHRKRNKGKVRENRIARPSTERNDARRDLIRNKLESLQANRLRYARKVFDGLKAREVEQAQGKIESDAADL